MSLLGEIYYKTNFFINTTPEDNITSTAKPIVVNVLICPVCTPTDTGASSMSSSPFLLLSGVESISGLLKSL